MDSPASEDRNLSLLPPAILAPPGPEFADEARQWQGIPGIERAPNGRLWAAWYSGGKGEGPGNYVLLATSGDDGATWSAPSLAIAPKSLARAYDPCLWLDPLSRLWVFWAQSYTWHDGRAGVWAMRCEDPGEPSPHWSPPRRICNGVMMNKPTVLTTGEWLAPAAVWGTVDPKLPELAAERFSNVVCSTDRGETWVRRGGADIPDRSFDEHMIVERDDGTLWMLVRTRYGIGESVSADRGFTWSPGRPTGIEGPCSRFFIRRLHSRRLLLVYHCGNEKGIRSHLTAMLSGDEGRTWPNRLLLDERRGVSYPDAAEADDGRIFAVYDHNRGDGKVSSVGDDREILMAVFREEDVLAGKLSSRGARLKQRVNKAGPR